MNGHKVPAVFRNFDWSAYPHLSKAEAFAEYLRNNLKAGLISTGTQFPSLQTLYEVNNMTFKEIKDALHLLRDEGYLILKVGQRGVGKFPPNNAGDEQPHDVIRANHYCKPTRFFMSSSHKHYQKIRVANSLLIAPALENGISTELLDLCTYRYNQLYSATYVQENFYYTHGLRIMLEAVALSVYKPGSAIAVPKNSYAEISRILIFLKIPFIEVETDTDGFNVTALESLCIKHQISAVFLMSRASFPCTIYTSLKRLKQLLSLKHTHNFTIVEVDFFLPWLEEKENPLIKLAGKRSEELIYIYPLTFLLKEVCEIMMVVTGTDLQKKIKLSLEQVGAPAYKTIAKSAAQILVHPDFLRAQREIAAVVQKHKVILLEVFCGDNFWIRQGLTADAGLAVFLRPKYKRFSKDAFSILKAAKIYAVDPQCYSGNTVEGIRLDFSNYIGHHDFEKNVKLVEKLCRSICS
jgi:DNA-binding transcriptional MocR family regulator